MQLAEFNALDTPRAAELVGVWAAVPHWVELVVSARPFDSVPELVQTAATAAASWTRDDLDAALAHHPRIGQRPIGTDASADASRSEQASMATARDDIAAAIARGNSAYEARFGRVFLIRAAGRSPEEMLAELRRRLDNDDETEASEALRELSQIAVLRLQTAVTDAANDRSHT